MTQRPILPFVSKESPEICKAWLDHLQPALPECEIARFDDQADYGDVQVALVANPDPAQLLRMPNLKWVQSLWAGVERLVEVLPPDLEIVRMTDPQLAKTMAEAVLTMTLALHRDLPLYRDQQAQALWKQHPVTLVSDRKVGVLGLGALGQTACASLVQNGFDVQGWSRSPKTLPNVTCFSGDDGLKDLLRATDILVVLLPLTEATRGLLNHDRLSLMKPSASIINFARGPIIDSDAMRALLNAGRLNHAVLDVFDQEPLPQSSPLWAHPKITVLPHVSAPTNMKTASAIVAGNIRLFYEAGQKPITVDRSRGY